MRISLCMIVKDEEVNLAACLRPVVDLFEEIILVDTGSTDRTREIATDFGAKVFDFPWNDSFADARNESLRHATGDWIFWLDADDRLDVKTYHELMDLFHDLPAKDKVAYVMPCHCTGTEEMTCHVRLFRNQPDLFWCYRAHEQILPALEHLDTELIWTDITIEHTGYQDVVLYHSKLERNLRLLELDNQEYPCEPWILFNLAMTKRKLGCTEGTEEMLRQALHYSHPEDLLVPELHKLLVQEPRTVSK